MLSCTFAYAFHVDLSPAKVDQGDAFEIRMTGVDAAEAPSASMDDNRISLALCGDGFIGIGAVPIDTKPGIHRIEVKAGGKNRSVKLVVKRAHFPKRVLTLPPGKVFLSREDTERAEKEEERMRLLWRQETEKLWDGNFILPLETRISTPFGAKRVLNRRKVSVHHGVDMKGTEGQEIRAANSGKVVLAEELFFGGNTVILDHGQGIYSIYMHLSGFDVKPGDMVLKGEWIGYVGSTGRSTGPHLHFGIQVMQSCTNPVSLTKLKL